MEIPKLSLTSRFHIFKWLSAFPRWKVVSGYLVFQFFILLVMSLGLRFGPVGQLASSLPRPGSLLVFCDDVKYQGKMEVWLKEVQGLSGGRVVSPFAAISMNGKMVDNREARFGWSSKLRRPTYFDSSNPVWNDKKYFCVPQGNVSILLHIFDFHFIGANDEIATGNISDVLQLAVAQHASRVQPEHTLLLSKPGGGGGGSVTLAIRFFPSMTYDEVIGSLDTGDVILFSGATRSGKFIEVATESQFSHIGLVLRDNTSLMVIESSTNRANLHDCDTGKISSGVEKLWLQDKIFCAFYNRVAIRRLHLLPASSSSSPSFPSSLAPPASRAELDQRVRRFYARHAGTPYEEFKLDMVKAEFNQNHKFDNSSLFCSEFVAYAFRSIGVFASSELPSNVLPNEFSTEKDNTLLSSDVYLENEIYIRKPQQWSKGRCYMLPNTCGCGKQQTAYDITFACWSQPCGSMFALWFGALWDAGLGLSLEIFIFDLVVLWGSSVLLVNVFILRTHQLWLAQTKKISPEEGGGEEGGGRGEDEIGGVAEEEGPMGESANEVRGMYGEAAGKLEVVTLGQSKEVGERLETTVNDE
uniref:C2 domain-containing protein n=1 Tax=Hanusia phi TaxID=3032 RepID=A0A7S0HET7_9CRYP|mmetsp:Transcript_1909/g.4252  ORF Transcript_1909/g.4252 Transcript_1909/m.4252 type:complete len:584 (+) Transcript_1909:1807-3558(+)